MPGPPQRIDDFSLTCAADTAVISDVRQGFAAWLRRFVPDTETVDDMALVLSELLANAVSATHDDDETVHVLACLEEEVVVLAVRTPRGTDHDAGRSGSGDHGVAAPGAGSEVGRSEGPAPRRGGRGRRKGMSGS